MEKEFEVSYGYKTFGGKIGAGLMTVESDDIEIVKSKALGIVISHLKDEWDDDDTDDPLSDITNINVSVKEKE